MVRINQLQMKIVGMLPVYNDEDIIQEVIENMIKNGIELVILDNGSTDNSYKYCESFIEKGVLELRRFTSDTFKIELVLRMLYDMAIKQSPDWVIVVASDEILESGTKNLPLNEAIKKADSQGYNMIQFDRFDFFMTDDDKSVKLIKEKMKYYSYQGDFVYRSWKYFQGIKIGDVAGHYPIFPNGKGYKISPKKFVMRHYPFRTKDQSKKKVDDRIRGTTAKSKDGRPLNSHYKKILNQDITFGINHTKLTKYEEDGNWNYEIKYAPHETIIPPKKEDLFTNEGSLKEKPASILELKYAITEKNKQLRKYRIIPKGLFLAKNFFKKRKE